MYRNSNVNIDHLYLDVKILTSTFRYMHYNSMAWTNKELGKTECMPLQRDLGILWTQCMESI